MKKTTIAIAGLGSRGLETYARCLERWPDRAELVAIADIRPDRLQVAAERYHIPADMCFDSVQSMLQQPKLADVLFICTPDDVHYLPAIGALEKGYHLLLEKPAARTYAEALEMQKVQHETGKILRSGCFHPRRIGDPVCPCTIPCRTLRLPERARGIR